MKTETQKKTACSWCGNAVEPQGGYWLTEPAGARWAAFCSLEHLVAWGVRDAHWEANETAEPQEVELEHGRCSYCEEALGETRVLLETRRGEHRIPNGFCSVDHLVSWAKESSGD